MKVKRLLVIDDNDNFITLVKCIFDYDNDWQVLTASNVRDGISQAQIYQPHVILLDIEMPEQNGFEGYKLLKANWATCFVPIIFVTAMEKAEEIIKDHIDEKVNIIMKPFIVAKLKEKVIRVFEHDFSLNKK